MNYSFNYIAAKLSYKIDFKKIAYFIIVLYELLLIFII